MFDLQEQLLGSKFSHIWRCFDAILSFPLLIQKPELCVSTHAE